MAVSWSGLVWSDHKNGSICIQVPNGPNLTHTHAHTHTQIHTHTHTHVVSPGLTGQLAKVSPKRKEKGWGNELIVT